jgi:hypothetical protein
MNEAEKRTILLIARTHKNMCIGVETFTKFLTDDTFGYFDFEPITREKLLTGYYGSIYGCKVWVSKHVSADHICISNLEIEDSRDINKWSISIPIDQTNQYQRIMKLKAFW